MQAAGDDARVDQAVELAQLGEHDGAHEARDGRHAHEEAEQRPTDALGVGVAGGDAVKSQHGGVQERQAHAGQKHGLPVVGLPALLAGAQEPLELAEAQRQVGHLLQAGADAAAVLCHALGLPQRAPIFETGKHSQDHCCQR